jgi:hypothetical protein
MPKGGEHHREWILIGGEWFLTMSVRHRKFGANGQRCDHGEQEKDDGGPEQRTIAKRSRESAQRLEVDVEDIRSRPIVAVLSGHLRSAR